MLQVYVLNQEEARPLVEAARGAGFGPLPPSLHGLAWAGQAEATVDGSQRMGQLQAQQGHGQEGQQQDAQRQREAPQPQELGQQQGGPTGDHQPGAEVHGGCACSRGAAALILDLPHQTSQRKYNLCLVKPSLHASAGCSCSRGASGGGNGVSGNSSAAWGSSSWGAGPRHGVDDPTGVAASGGQQAWGSAGAVTSQAPECPLAWYKSKSFVAGSCSLWWKEAHGRRLLAARQGLAGGMQACAQGQAQGHGVDQGQQGATAGGQPAAACMSKTDTHMLREHTRHARKLVSWESVPVCACVFDNGLEG